MVPRPPRPGLITGTRYESYRNDDYPRRLGSDPTIAELEAAELWELDEFVEGRRKAAEQTRVALHVKRWDDRAVIVAIGTVTTSTLTAGLTLPQLGVPLFILVIGWIVMCAFEHVTFRCQRCLDFKSQGCSVGDEVAFASVTLVVSAAITILGGGALNFLIRFITG